MKKRREQIPLRVSTELKTAIQKISDHSKIPVNSIINEILKRVINNSTLTERMLVSHDRTIVFHLANDPEIKTGRPRKERAKARVKRAA